MLPTPCTHFQISRIGEPVASFLVGIQPCKGCFLPNFRQDIRQFTRVNFDAPTQCAQMCVQNLQGLSYKFEVLKGSIGLKPQFGLDDIKAPNRPLFGGVRKCGMVVPSQIAF
jgi:hypothetical protein